MATIQKRGGTWRVQVRRRGKALSATFDTKVEAEHWAIRTESQMIDGIVPQAPARRIVEPAGETAAAIFQRYADEVSPKKRGGRWEQVRLRASSRSTLFSRQRSPRSQVLMLPTGGMSGSCPSLPRP